MFWAPAQIWMEMRMERKRGSRTTFPLVFARDGDVSSNCSVSPSVTFNLLEKLPLTYFHVFPFSPRKGTPAYQMEGQINPNIKKKRSEMLRNLSISKRLDFHKRFLGKTRKVLWEERRKNNKFTGYTDNYIRVILDENYNADLRNQIHPVKLNRINGQNMLAKFVS